MYVTEIGLRRLFRSPICEGIKEVIDVEDIKRRALSGEKPYDYFGVSLGENPSVLEINCFVYTYCIKRGLSDKDVIESYIGQVAGAIAVHNARAVPCGGEGTFMHQYYLDLAGLE